jgi:hypothetical protein
MWNPTVVGLLHRQPSGHFRRVDQLPAAGPGPRFDILIRRGHLGPPYASARSETPVELKVRPRKGGTDIEMQEIVRLLRFY